MSCCRNHKSHSHHNHRHERPGSVRRVTRGLAKKFGVPRKVVLAGFIIGLIINVPLTIVIFLIALYWVDHPGELEKKVERGADKMRRFWAGSGHRGQRPAYAGPDTADVGEEHSDFDFADLRQQFDDLERRASDMEAHVSSEEFHLNKEIDDIRSRKSGDR